MFGKQQGYYENQIPTIREWFESLKPNERVLSLTTVDKQITESLLVMVTRQKTALNAPAYAQQVINNRVQSKALHTQLDVL